jgi:hypothetical protein
MRSHHVVRALVLLALTAVILLIGTGIAGAQSDGTTYPTISTTPTTDPGTSATESQVGGVSASRSLPFSGGDVGLLTLLGLVAVGSGVAIVVIARRRSTPARA